MPDFLIRGLDEWTMRHLKERAEENGRSLNAEIKATLKKSFKMTKKESIAATERLLARDGGKVWPDSTPLIREDRER